jgi:hypothetical protein
MDERDIAVRNRTYALFVERGRAPSGDEVARASGVVVEDIQRAWERLHRDHALVLQPGRLELLMASPFSAVPTPYRVFCDDRWWYANCAWDAFGICAALKADGHIEASCPDCGEPIAIDVRGERPHPENALFHCMVPASRWWDDIAFT